MKDLTFRQKVIQGIHDLFYIWKREFGTTFRDQGVLIFFVLVPLVYPLIYAFIYTNETIHEVPTVVVDDSRSSLSREYLRKSGLQSRSEPRELLRRYGRSQTDVERPQGIRHYLHPLQLQRRHCTR